MKMTKLLVGAATAALLAGSASAYDLVAANTGVASTSTSGFEVEAAVSLAAELDFAAGAHNGDFEFYIDQQTAGTFTTDDVLLTVTLTNGTFDQAVTVANIDAACASGASVSTGGAAGSSSVVFLVSGIDGCDGSAAGFLTGDDFGFSLPIDLTGAGDLGISTNMVTDSGSTPVDGGTATLGFVSLDDAYDVNILASGTDSIADLDANPIYTSFDGAGGNGIIGTLELDCNTAIDIDLNGTAVDCNTDINAITATLSGDVSAFTAGVDVATVIGTNNVAEDESTADLSGLLASAGFGPTNIELNEDGDVINPSDYTLSVSVDLVAGFIDESAFNGTLDSVVREGTTVVVPWFASAAIAAANNSTNVFRISNISSADARVFVEVLTASDGTFVDPGIVETGSPLSANGEMVMTSGTITTLLADDPGRADLRITIEQTEDNLTFRRFVTAPDGSLTEMTVGTVDQDLDG
ncbi:hypothetical protein GCM10017621_21790 [Maricaulis virginensis]|uniref:Choice-of-anchor D domain-containing protein n=2 Tax=Maricaulis virginensis TaxID=144022 RepID=A0A9W6IPC0_9PROT|nr:hypothetical protein GCM10017621_21790 [Maricaulis virginensis]